MLPDKIKMLDLSVGNNRSGQLLHQSRFEFRYLDASLSQTPVGFSIPGSQAAAPPATMSRRSCWPRRLAQPFSTIWFVRTSAPGRGLPGCSPKS